MPWLQSPIIRNTKDIKNEKCIAHYHTESNRLCPLVNCPPPIESPRLGLFSRAQVAESSILIRLYRQDWYCLKQASYRLQNRKGQEKHSPLALLLTFVNYFFTAVPVFFTGVVDFFTKGFFASGFLAGAVLLTGITFFTFTTFTTSTSNTSGA